MGKWRYGVILDAGSSGTRVHIYKWLDSVKSRSSASRKELKSLPQLMTHKRWTKKIHPGVSTFSTKADLVGPDHLEPLLSHAIDIIPDHALKDTPIFLLATAGVRLLPEPQRNNLLANICAYAKSTTPFLLPDCDLHVRAIPGETEGLYGWIAANYLLGGFDSPESHDHGKGHHTYGFLDMGGASAQIAFAPNATEAEKHAEDLKRLRLRTVDGTTMEYKVFVTTWLGFGVNEARRRYVDALLESSATHDARELPDPCLPVELSITKSGKVIPAGSKAPGNEPALIGTGRFDECLRSTYPLLDKDAPCENQPCLLNGVHVPAIDFDVNHFVGVSEYWHTTHGVFELPHDTKSYDFHTYQGRVRDFCSQDWETISKGVKDQLWGKKVDERTVAEACFKASWLINVLHDGIGIPRIGVEKMPPKNVNGTMDLLKGAKSKGFLDPFQAVDKIEDTEVSWTLGKMVMYAASQVPSQPEDLPVGFGSNIDGIPSDFQYAGSAHSLTNVSDDSYDDEAAEWKETILDTSSSGRLTIFVILLIICLALFFTSKRERRGKLFRRFNGAFGFLSNPKKRRVFSSRFFGSGATRTYERILENGDPMAELEMGGVDSDNDEHSDSSDGTRAGRSSGWASPRVKIGLDHGSGSYFDHVVSQGGLGLGLDPPPPITGNAMDRNGLVVRTESRERLMPLTNTAVSGKRSRNVSPTRKSPLITKEDSFD